MNLSHNGWPVQDNDSSRLRTLPGISGKVLAGDVWIIFSWLIEQYAKRVEPIKQSDSWGHNKRKVRGGSSSWSNHASGTAIDLNSTAHPFKASGTMSKRQVAECHRIVAESGQVLRWLEGFDEMHWEIRPGATAGQVHNLARKITEKEPTMAELTDIITAKVLPNPDPANPKKWSLADYAISARRQANIAAKRAEKILAKLEGPAAS